MTQLAVSPNGEQLLLTLTEKFGGDNGFTLIKLSGHAVTSTRAVALPRTTLTTAWSRSERHVLVTTFDGAHSELLRIDVESGAKTLLYRSAFKMGLPLEIEDDHHVFLETYKPGEDYSRWQRLKGGVKTLFSEEVYTGGATLNHVQRSLFFLEPRNPPLLRVFEGQVPAEVPALIDASTWAIRCSDTKPAVCVRMHVFFNPLGQTYATLDVSTAARRCRIGDRWGDVRELRISSDGSTVVFHAPLQTDDTGPRSLFIVKPNDSCATEQINLPVTKS